MKTYDLTRFKLFFSHPNPDLVVAFFPRSISKDHQKLLSSWITLAWPCLILLDGNLKINDSNSLLFKMLGINIGENRSNNVLEHSYFWGSNLTLTSSEGFKTTLNFTEYSKKPIYIEPKESPFLIQSRLFSNCIIFSSLSSFSNKHVNYENASIMSYLFEKTRITARLYRQPGQCWVCDRFFVKKLIITKYVQNVKIKH